MTCSTCRYWKPGRPGWGSCRRYPPMGADGMWPGTAGEAWCGEHAMSAEALDYRHPVTVPLPPVELLDDMDAMGVKYDPSLRPTALPPKGKKA